MVYGLIRKLYQKTADSNSKLGLNAPCLLVNNDCVIRFKHVPKLSHNQTRFYAFYGADSKRRHTRGSKKSSREMKNQLIHKISRIKSNRYSKRHHKDWQGI